LLAVAPLAAWFFLHDPATAPGPEAALTTNSAACEVDETAIPVTDPTIDDDPLQLESRTLGKGRTMDGVLRDLGIPSGERFRLLQALRPHLDLRRLPPQTGIVVGHDAEGAPKRLAIRPEPDRFVRLRLAGPEGEPLVEPVALSVRTSIETTGGRLESSVSQALSDCPRGIQLTQAFAEIFQWDVDLLVDPRPGDVVSVVYEEQRLAAVPPDLPPFGEAARESGEFLKLGRIVAARYDGRNAASSAFWVEGPEGEGGYFDATGQALQKTFLKSPLNYRRISSRFSGARLNPVTRKVVPHHGVDFAASAGTPVVAAADGRVAFTGWNGPLGRAVRIRHGSDYETIYGHLSRIARGIAPGSEVRQNQLIGYVGSTGRATGPHLHYTMVVRGKPIDPLKFRNPPAEPLPAELLPQLERARSSWSPLLDSIPRSIELAASDGGSGPGA
jgi:murein DD-endopeptidase MepM/ murein hydrolase activator NlpD